MLIATSDTGSDLEWRIIRIINLATVDPDEDTLHGGLRDHLGLLNLQLHFGLLLARLRLLPLVSRSFLENLRQPV